MKSLDDDSAAAGTAAAPADPAPLEIAPGSIDGVLDLGRLFASAGPVELEIGTGKGRFLLDQAEARPEVRFLGVEWSLKYARIARARAEQRGLTNIRFLRADARHVLADLVGDASFERVHVYCPDPWPKKRHHKRRLFAPDVAPHLERVLVPGGFLHVSTDVRDYLEEIVTVLRAATRLVEAADPLFPATAEGRTSYEIKYVNAGRPIHRAAFRKPAARP